ncbi:ABC transporter permease [soil metagenome]
MSAVLPRRARLAVWFEPRLIVGASLLLVLLAVALFAPWLAPHDPNEQDLLSVLLPPAWAPDGQSAYPLGTDGLGQCILSRLIWSSRIAVIIAFTAPLGAALIGTALALLAGYRGGRTEWLIMRLVDVWMSFPAIVLALVLMVALGPGLANVIIAIVLVDWTRFCRVLRADVVVLRRRDYISAARIAGARPLAIIARDIVPGIRATLISMISIEMGIAIVAESILSFVGMSVEPDRPTWGVMIADGLKNVFTSPVGLIAPVLCTVLVVLATTLLGDGLRRASDPRLLER